MAKNIAVTASAALPPWLKMAVPVLTAKGSSPTAKPLLWEETAFESPPNPNVEPIVDPSEQPARMAANGKARKDVARKGMTIP
jgi:hypothetical protein